MQKQKKTFGKTQWCVVVGLVLVFERKGKTCSCAVSDGKADISMLLGDLCY